MAGLPPDPASVLPCPDAMADALREALPQFRQVDWAEHPGSTNAALLERAPPPGGPPDPDCVLPCPDAMAAALREALPQFRQVDWVEHTGSTNADLLERARRPGGPPDRPWLLGTHLQSRGRGRAGRTWQNRVGANLMFSCAFDVF